VGGPPELRPLLARLPAVAGLAQREDALLGPGALLVAAGPAEGGVVPALVECFSQRDGLHDPRVLVGAVGEGRDALLHALLVGVHQEIDAELARRAVTELDHLPELPGGVDVQDRERHLARRERLAGEGQQARGVLAHAVTARFSRTVESVRSL